MTVENLSVRLNQLIYQSFARLLEFIRSVKRHASSLNSIFILSSPPDRRLVRDFVEWLTNIGNFLAQTAIFLCEKVYEYYP